MILKRINTSKEWVLSLDEVTYRFRCSGYARSGEPPSKAVRSFLENPNGLFSKAGKADIGRLVAAVQTTGFATPEPDLCGCGQHVWRSMARGPFHIVEPCQLWPSYDEHGVKREYQPA